jgi:AcrR family transcriptional regulator
LSSRRVRRQPREHTRERLLDAAARVFAERGFHGASVEAVSEEAGYSTGALYSNFASKEELFLSLYEDRIERRRRELRDAVAEGSDAASAFASVADAVGQSLRQDRDFFLLYFEFALHAARNPAFNERFEAIRAEALTQLTDGLTKVFERAGVTTRLPPREIARAIRGLSYGLALDRVLDDTVTDDLLTRILQVSFSGARAGAPPPRTA